MTFYGISRGIARFGLLASGSMTLTLLARLIPAFTVVYWIGISAALLSLLGYAALCPEQHRPFCLIVLACLLSGVTLGGWDAVAGLLADDSGKALILQLALLVGVFGLSSAIAKIFFQPKATQEPQPVPTFFPIEDNDLWTSDT